MKNKIVENILESLLEAMSKKTNERTKNFALNKISASIPLIITGGYLSFCNTYNYDPLGAIVLLNNFGIDSKYLMTSSFLGAAAILYKKDSMLNDIAKYGADYCPYHSYSIGIRELNGKKIQQKVNKFYDIYSKLGNNSQAGKVTKDTGKKIESILENLGNGINKIADFFDKKDIGFKIYSNKNPKLISELIIPRDLKIQAKANDMDEDNNYKVNQRKFVNELIQIAIKNTEEEIKERNIVIALVKAIDKIKMGNYDEKEIEIIKDIMNLDNLTRTGRIKPFENINQVLNLIIKDNKIDFSIQFFKVKNWSKELNQNERTFYIFKEIDKLCYNNNIKILKKPLRYEEIYRNETIIEFQNKLRSNFVRINREIQDNAPIIYEHFIKGKEFKLNNDYSITKMLGVKKREILNSLFEESNTLNIKEVEVKSNYRYKNINSRRG